MPDYVKTMGRLQDEDLLRIVHADSSTEYEPDAIKAAQSEIDRRGISEAAMHDIEREVEQERADQLSRPEAQLSNAEMAGFLLFGPVLIASVPLAVMLGARGYPGKSRGAFGAIMLSFPLYFTVFGVFVFATWLFGI